MIRGKRGKMNVSTLRIEQRNRGTGVGGTLDWQIQRGRRADKRMPVGWSR